MPAHSDTYPWKPYYGYRRIEDSLRGHAKVSHVSHLGDGVFRVARVLGDELTLFVCECYSFGVAELDETLGHLGAVDLILVNSMWCGYTDAAKKEAFGRQIGVFDFSELMGALHRQEIWRYVPKTQK